MKVFFLLFIFFSLIACTSVAEDKKEVSVINSVEDFDMYVPSEMSLHMNTMFEINENLKQKIITDVPLGEFPEDLLKIYTAKLSDTKSRNEIFKAYSKVFIENEKELFNEASTIPLVERYNNTINSCVMCHKTECVGPIPRIEKLLIK